MKVLIKDSDRFWQPYLVHEDELLNLTDIIIWAIYSHLLQFLSIFFTGIS